MGELTDAPGGALIDLDGLLLHVALWGVPTIADYDVIAATAVQAPCPGLVRLDLSGLVADPDEALALVGRLERAGAVVELVLAPGGRIARRLDRRHAAPLRLVDDVA